MTCKTCKHYGQVDRQGGKRGVRVRQRHGVRNECRGGACPSRRKEKKQWAVGMTITSRRSSMRP